MSRFKKNKQLVNKTLASCKQRKKWIMFHFSFPFCATISVEKLKIIQQD